MKGGESEFWSGRGLRSEDWVGLTSLLYSEIFSPEFLTPMQEADTTFHLRVEHWNLTRYLNMVLESDWHDDTDVARAVHTPRGNIHIGSPYLDPSLFNPLAMTGTHLASLPGARRSRRRWEVSPPLQPNLLPRLCVPLPVPHPAEVAIIVHNRDHEDQISMESCRPIIRDLRDSSQPLSGEYLTSDDLKEDTDSCSSQYPSLGGRSHSESVYEVGRDLESLSQSLEDLDIDLKRPVLVQVSARSQPRLDTASASCQPLVAQYSVRSEVSAVKMRPRLITTSSESQQRPDPGRGRLASEGSMARIASAEDMRIETETVVMCPLSQRGQSTVV